MNKQLKKYYKQIKKELVCDKKYKYAVIKDLDKSVKTYLLSNEGSIIDDVILHFGEPKSYVQTYKSIESFDHLKHLSRKYVRLKLSFIFSTIFIIILLIIGYFILRDLLGDIIIRK